MKLADTLRSKCAAKGLGISGSTEVLFERLKRFEKKGKAKPGPKPKKVKPIILRCSLRTTLTNRS